MLLVHFKSRDLAKLTSQAQFWHCMFLNGGVLVSQDESETWTVHKMVPPDTDHATVDSLELIFSILGGLAEPYPVNVDEILVKSIWKSEVAVADAFRSAQGRVFLAGDAGKSMIRSMSLVGN